MASSSFACLAVVLLVGYVQCQDARDPIVQPDDPERVNRFNPFPEDEFGRDRGPFEQDQSDPACLNKVMDIFFILDSSTSIWVNDYNQELQFVQDVVSRLDISPVDTRVGVLTFSDDLTRPAIDLNRHSTKRDLLNNINNRVLPYRTGITNTHLAISYVRENSLFRSDITKVIVVITDGGSRTPALTLREATLARNEDGFYVFVVGIGQYREETEWRNMASDPYEQFVYNITNFRLLGSVSQSLPPRACSLPPIIIKSCTVNNPAHVTFASSNQGYEQATALLNFFKGETRDQLNRLHVNTLINRCREQENVFLDELNCAGFPQFGSNNFEDTVRRIRNLVQRYRNGPRQIAVIVIDEQTFAREWNVARSYIDSMIDSNNDVIIVTLGVRDFNGDLNNYENVIRFNSGPMEFQRDLQRRMVDMTCTKINEFNFVLPN